MNLLNLMVLGPLVGVQKRRKDVAHAITYETFIEAGCGQRLPTAPCGAKHLYFLSDAAHRVVLWPIYDKGEMTRCRECWIATGKKRPAKVRNAQREVTA